MSDVYFVMLTTQSGRSIPMMRNEEVAFYETIEDAKLDAQNNPLGASFGFEVFELGGGVYCG